jgi:hypothetical protein
MTIDLKCDQCGKSYQLKDSLAGKRVKCKCGNSMTVPAARAIDDDPLGLSDAGMPGPLDDLLGAELPTGGGSTLPASARSATPAPTAATRARKMKRVKKEKKEGMSNTMASLVVAGFIVGVFAFVGIGLFLASALKKTGFESPEAAFAAHQEALHNKDWAAQIQTYTPDSQRDLASAVTWYAVDKLANRKEIKQALEDHGLTSTFTSDSLSDRDAVRQSFSVTDVVKCYEDMVRAVDTASEDRITNSLLRAMHRREKGDRIRERAGGTLRDLAVNGGTAAATIFVSVEDNELEDPVTFRQIEGRWFIELSESDLYGNYFLGMDPLF